MFDALVDFVDFEMFTLFCIVGFCEKNATSFSISKSSADASCDIVSLSSVDAEGFRFFSFFSLSFAEYFAVL